MTDERKTDGQVTDEQRIRDRYRDASTEQPPATLDARILAAARETVAEPPAARPAWRPLAVAAVVLLSATLVITIRPPDDEATTPATVAGEDTTGPAELAREPAAAPSRRQAAAQADTATPDEIVVTGSRTPTDEENAVAGTSGKAVAQFAERERRMVRIEADEMRSDTTAEAAEIAIEAIVEAWDAGDTAEAERLLDAFADAYPDYPEAELRDALPEALLGNRPRQ